MPNVVDIIQSIQVPQLIKDKYIRQGTPVLDGRGRPVHFTGGFAVVFPFLVNGSKWAFRCWSADIGNVERRLHSLSSELKQLSLPYFCEFSYEPVGIVINGETYPTTRMQWIDGKTIKDYICEYMSDATRMQKLADDFLHMCETLHQHKIAHGDLQHGNILVDDSGAIYLIDYDSVYLPALKGETDIISGLPDYQHPKRKENRIATEKLDYFSELIIYLSIRAITENPQLADKYQVKDADRLLFTKEDFVELKNAPIYNDIKSLGQEFKGYLDVLEEYLGHQDINELVPFEFCMLNQKVSFTASATKAVRNTQSIELVWDVPFDAEIVLRKGKDTEVQQCEKQGTFTTSLSESTTFELAIKTSNGQVIKKEISINVFDECEIEFTADKYYVFPTIPVKLSWKVKNAKKIWLDDEEIPSSGTKIIEPKKPKECVLLAEDEFGVKKKWINIEMLPIPQVKSILVPTPNTVSNMSLSIQQPRYNVEVKFPQLDIGWVKTEVPKVKSLKDLGLNIELSPPLPKFNLMSSIKKVFNQIIRK